MSDSTHKDLDEQVGMNLRSFRGGMKQADLSAKMRERGHKWSQNTVYQVEAGDRPVRLSEARDLSDILNFPLEELFATPKDSELEKVADAQIEELRELWEHYAKTIRRFRDACRNFLEKEPSDLTEEESEELWQIKKAKQDEWLQFNFWSGFLEATYREKLEWHGYEPEPLDYYDFEQEALESYGVEKAAGFNVADKLFDVDGRARRKKEQEELKNFSSRWSSNTGFTPPF